MGTPEWKRLHSGHLASLPSGHLKPLSLHSLLMPETQEPLSPPSRALGFTSCPLEPLLLPARTGLPVPPFLLLPLPPSVTGTAVLCTGKGRGGVDSEHAGI